MTDRYFEEMVAASYEVAGFDKVILTPRSGDLGRDVIATRNGFYSVRVLDQAKRYSPGNLVPAKDVRELYGVLMKDQKASKGLVTTTSDFAPGVAAEFADLMPTRLELINGTAFIKRMAKT